MTRSLIEQWLPAAAVGAESLRDASAAKKPPNSRLHVWWARRPLTASRAAVLASLLPAWPDERDLADDPRAREVLAGLHREFPDGERSYQAWTSAPWGSSATRSPAAQPSAQPSAPAPRPSDTRMATTGPLPELPTATPCPGSHA